MRSLGIFIMVIGLLAITWNTLHIAELNLDAEQQQNNLPAYPQLYLLYGLGGLIVFIVGALIYRIAARKARMNDVRMMHFGLK